MTNNEDTRRVAYGLPVAEPTDEWLRDHRLGGCVHGPRAIDHAYVEQDRTRPVCALCDQPAIRHPRERPEDA